MALMTFGEFLAVLRKKRFPGLSMSQVARKLGYSPGYISMLEAGQREPTLKLLQRITRMFGVQMEYLVYFCPPDLAARVDDLLFEDRHDGQKKSDFFRIDAPPPDFLTNRDRPTLSTILSDRRIFAREKFRKTNPKLPRHIIELIIELYEKWDLERVWRETLEEEAHGSSTDLYSPKPPLPESLFKRNWEYPWAEEVREREQKELAMIQLSILENLDKLIDKRS